MSLPPLLVDERRSTFAALLGLGLARAAATVAALRPGPLEAVAAARRARGRAAARTARLLAAWFAGEAVDGAGVGAIDREEARLARLAALVPALRELARVIDRHAPWRVARERLEQVLPTPPALPAATREEDQLRQPTD
jgi:hypothetical protein